MSEQVIIICKIILDILLIPVILWLLDFYCGCELQERRDEERQEQRMLALRQDFDEQITFRLQLDREQLFRDYEKMEVQDDRA